MPTLKGVSKLTCFHPITVYQKAYRTLTDNLVIQKHENTIKFHEIKDGIKIEIPCGHCLGCRLDHASIWATRIANEAECWKNNCFVTLTYNSHGLRTDGSPNLPITITGKTTLWKQDVQKFLKRLRKHEQGLEEIKTLKFDEDMQPYTVKEKPIRYFYCGEYGHSGTRAKIGGNPHYHMAIFNWIPDDLKYRRTVTTGDLTYDLFTSEKLQKYWTHGFVIIGMLNYETASYIARYVQKKAGITAKKRQTYIDQYGDKHYKRPGEEQAPEFIQMSTRIGIGKLYWQQNKDKIKRNSGIHIKTETGLKLKPIPRYYKKLWEKENYEEYYRWKYEQTQNGIKKRLEILAMETWKHGEYTDIAWTTHLIKEEKLLKIKSKYLRRDHFQDIE